MEFIGFKPNGEVNAYIKEYERKQQPTIEDYSELASLLSDFCIHTLIPVFRTKGELLNWQKYTIQNNLA